MRASGRERTAVDGRDGSDRGRRTRDVGAGRAVRNDPRLCYARGMLSSRSLHLVTLASLALACDPTPASPEDAGTDAPPATCDTPPTLEDGDPNGHAEPL